MGNAGGCQCVSDCNQGTAAKNTWSKPQQPLAVVQENAVATSQSPVPDSAEPVTEDSTGGSALRPTVDDAAACSANESPPKPEAEEVPPNPEAEETLPKPEPLGPVNGVLRFEVSVVKGAGEGYGLGHVPVADGSNTLLIVGLQDQGKIAQWNDAREKGDEKTARKGDRIVAVSGNVNDTDAMRAQLRQDSIVLTIERWPDTLVLALVKRSPADKYGLATERFQREDGTVTLQVAEIGQGLMSEWNRAACESRRFHEIVTNMFEIVKLDEFADDPEKMQEALTTRDSVELTFRRPDPSCLHK